MLTLGTIGHIYLAVEPQDGRKGIDGLAGVVTAALKRNPTSGDLLVFKNKKGDRLKILAWELLSTLAAQRPEAESLRASLVQLLRRLYGPKPEGVGHALLVRVPAE